MTIVDYTCLSGPFSPRAASLAEKLGESDYPPFDFAVIDEAQDVGVAQLRFLAALGSKRPDGLFFTGDLGQRIFQEPFSWEALGVDVRGRSTTLKVNYRTSHQIRTQADRLLDPMLVDVDGNEEVRSGDFCVQRAVARCPSVRFSGQPEPGSRRLDQARHRRGVEPHEIAVFVRSETELPRAQDALARADVSCETLDHKLKVKKGSVSVTTMHRAKGLEFRAVAAMACDDEIIPRQTRIGLLFALDCSASIFCCLRTKPWCWSQIFWTLVC